MKKKKLKTSKILLVIIIILTVILLILLLIKINPLKKYQDFTKAPEKFIIPDECSSIMGNLIHQMKTDGECNIYCRNYCEIKEMEFYESNFIEKQQSCHICECYCK